jgi:hypothetical protein
MSFTLCYETRIAIRTWDESTHFMLQKYADDLGIQLIEASAKEAVNIEEAFIRLATDIKKNLQSSNVR